jgi:ankyrin repeat protein
MDYPKPLKLIQDGKIDEFVHLINSSDDPKHIINEKHVKSGDNSAIVAARHGRLRVLEILHRNGMDFELWNADGKRPLHEAAYGANLACVKFLINVGVEFDCLKRADWYVLILQYFCTVYIVHTGMNIHCCVCHDTMHGQGCSKP